MKRDTEEIIKFVNEITAEMSVLPGSVLRVPLHAYYNWGIDFTKNMQWLYNESQKAYECEWATTDSSLNVLVGQASKLAGLQDVNMNLNLEIGERASDHLLNLIYLNRQFTLVDIGAGSGNTTLCTLRNLNEQIKDIKLINNKEHEIILIEPSTVRLQEAYTNVESELNKLSKKGLKVNVTLYDTKDINALSVLAEQNKKVSTIITNASIHHNSFDYHLFFLSKVMDSRSMLITGDWYDSLSYHPVHLYNIMKEMKVSKIKLDKYKKFFDLDPEFNLKEINSQLSKEEIKANEQIMEFWLSVGKIFENEGKKAPIQILESHELVRDRLSAMKRYNIESDESKIKLAFPKYKSKKKEMVEGSKLASVRTHALILPLNSI
jgi:hypothetical protein